MVIRARAVALSALVVVLLLAGISPAGAGYVDLTTIRISEASNGTGGNDWSGYPAISSDGRTIVFYSTASNLVNGDTNGAADVFAYSVPTGAMSRVSVNSDGDQATGPSSFPSVSSDGTRILFISSAANLDPRPVGAFGDLYLHETTTRTTTRLTAGWDGNPINGEIRDPEISDDGNTVVFATDASNIVTGDYNGYRDVFVMDISDPATPSTTRISTAHTGGDTNEHSYQPAASGDGSTILFTSYATNIVPDDTNTALDVFAYDRATEVTTRISLTSAGGQANAHSDQPDISSDGNTIVFHSRATNMTADDGWWDYDVYLLDVLTGDLSLISTALDGSPGNEVSRNPRISADGATIVYESDATDLVDADTNGLTDVFAFEIASGTTVRVSVATDGSQVDDETWYYADVSGDGSRVVYPSPATTLIAVDGNAEADVFYTEILNRSPVVADATLEVAEDTAIGGLVGFVPAVDPDKDDLDYTVTAGDDDVFAVDTHGRVTTLTLLDFETRDGYTLTVEVTDGSYSETSHLDIAVTNINERPATANVAVTVAEDTTVGTVVTTVDGSDPDDDPVTFAITRGPDDLFAIDPDDGEISVVAGLDHEVESEHTLTVTVSDGSLDAEAIVTIGVDDVNEPPVVTGFDAQVSEDVAVGHVLGAVAVYDPEDDMVAHSISAGNDEGLFAIDTVGVITVAGGLDHETASSHVLTVAATDGEFSATATVNVDVTDIYEVDPAFDPYDDDGALFEASIEWLAYHEITKGCAPRLYCPDDLVTRGQMAAFLSRALDLPATDDDFFIDDEDSIFAGHINRLAAAGITKGCNPSEGNTEFCVDDPITRGQMAAFLVRALGYADDGGGDIFDDDDGSIFESSIDKLATAGVTRGCNPPDNTEFCPDAFVTRGQMAAFLFRALG